MPDRSALHENDRMVSVAAHRRCRHFRNVFRTALLLDRFEGKRGKMGTFIDDHMTVSTQQLRQIFLAGQRLHHGHVDYASRLGLATSDDSQIAFGNIEKCRQSLQPFGKKKGRSFVRHSAQLAVKSETVTEHRDPPAWRCPMRSHVFPRVPASIHSPLSSGRFQLGGRCGP